MDNSWKAIHITILLHENLNTEQPNEQLNFATNEKSTFLIQEGCYLLHKS